MQVSFVIAAFAWALVSYVIYLFVSGFLESRRNAAKALALKCEKPVAQRNRWVWGIDQIVRAIKADRAQLFPVDLMKRTEEAGALTFSWKLFGSENFNTADEKNIQAILATQFVDFDLGPMRRGNFWPLLGNGIFTQDGFDWEHSRAMMRPQFAREQVSDLNLEETHVQHMMSAINDHLREDNWTNCIDLQVLFFRLTLDSATEFLFGESVASQESLRPREKNHGDALQPSSDFAAAFDRGQMALATRARFAHNYWLVNPKGFKDACKVCHEFIDHYVRLALSKDTKEKASKKDMTGAKTKYVFLDALAAETQDPIELRSQLLNILLAGRDTTASLLGWLFLLLAKDPARYAKLRAIVIEEFGTYDNPKEITFSKLKSCQYLQHCNNETLRLYPIVPVNGRFANKDTTLPRGGGKDGMSKIFIPAGTAVDYSVHVMHHRKDIWGPDAEDFRPERWENRRVGWEFLPFNGGPRICIGQQFALTEASYVTVRLLQRWDKMEYLETDPVIRHRLTLTNCSGNGVKVRMHAA